MLLLLVAVFFIGPRDRDVGIATTAAPEPALALDGEAEAAGSGAAPAPGVEAAGGGRMRTLIARYSARLSSEAREDDCVQAVEGVTKLLSGPGPGELSDEQVQVALNQLRRAAIDPSGDDALLASVLLVPRADTSPQDAADQLRELGQRAVVSRNPLLAWHALRACVRAGGSCPITHLEAELLQTQPQNAEAWALAAELRYGRGDAGGALAAMEHAAAAQTANWYWPESVAVIKRAMAAQTDIPYADRVATAFGAMAAAVSPWANALCQAESRSSRCWAEACLALAKLRAEHNETHLGRTLGYGLQASMQRVLGDEQGAMEAETLRLKANAAQLTGGPAMSAALTQLGLVLLAADPVQLGNFLDDIRASGEMEALRRLPQQAASSAPSRADGAAEKLRECLARSAGTEVMGGWGTEATAYRVQPGNELHITYRGGEPGEGLAIREVGPGGEVRLAEEPITHVPAAGRTLAELERDISALFGPETPSRRVTVLAIPAWREST